MRKNIFSRRDFLKLAGTTSAGLALSACGVKATEVPTPASPPTLVPSTQALTPTSTSLPTPTPLPNTLRRYADALGINIGVVAETNGFDEALIRKEFNEIAVSSIGWEVIGQGGENSYDFSIPDWFIGEYAVKSNLAVLAMHLVFGVDLPAWLKNGNFSRERLIEIMKNHVKQVMQHYKGQVRAYTVVNEASEPSIFWNRRVGSKYVEIAFQAARETDPNAILIYNDSGHEMARLPKSNKVFNLVKALKEKDLVDAVGFQMHILGEPDSYIDPRTPPTKAELLEQMSRYGEIGVKVFVTELDVDIGKLPGTKEEKLAKQAEIYSTVVEACLESSGICNDINMWGISDVDAWRGEAPLLFTASFKRKPAYFAVLDVLKKHYDEQK
ncbi:MAG TPA: endo-1,4-beta-xylanase [Anaerolineales bacterium]|nr:endo-1,4-beta-xylanase [Anaerolineales bacterium]